MRWLRTFLHPVYVTGHKPNGCKVTSNPSELRVRPEREHRSRGKRDGVLLVGARTLPFLPRAQLARLPECISLKV